MRKFVLSALALFLCVGLTLAAQVTFVKYDEDKKELTVKGDDDKKTEKTYKISDETKFKNNKKDMTSEKGTARFKKMKVDTKFEITTDGDKLTEVKFLPRMKKK
ncbi:MAG TPA: hypothetical protein VGJ05_13580 [Fimbriiglobus sp.]|jgi:hypothetical protein